MISDHTYTVGTKIVGAHSIEELARKLKHPRKVMPLVKAGKCCDDFIEQLIPHLEKGDIIIDSGDSHFPDTIRRCNYLEKKRFLIYWLWCIWRRRWSLS